MTKESFMESLLIEKLPNSGLDYEEYFEQFKIKSELEDFSAYPEEEHEHLQLAKLNFQRSSRIHKTFKTISDTKKFRNYRNIK